MQIRICCCTVGRFLGEESTRFGAPAWWLRRTPSSDLANFVHRDFDGILPSLGYLRLTKKNKHPGTRNPPDDLQTLWIVYVAHGDRHKAWPDFTREATLEVFQDWPLDDGRSALLYMVKHFEKHGGDGLSWLASWCRQKEINEHERTTIEMRCLITCLHVRGTYDQLNSQSLAYMETVAWRIA